MDSSQPRWSPLKAQAGRHLQISSYCRVSNNHFGIMKPVSIPQVCNKSHDDSAVQREQGAVAFNGGDKDTIKKA
jgi:hypothetical protein